MADRVRPGHTIRPAISRSHGRPRFPHNHRAGASVARVAAPFTVAVDRSAGHSSRWRRKLARVEPARRSRTVPSAAAAAALAKHLLGRRPHASTRATVDRRRRAAALAGAVSRAAELRAPAARGGRAAHGGTRSALCSPQCVRVFCLITLHASRLSALDHARRPPGAVCVRGGDSASDGGARRSGGPRGGARRCVHAALQHIGLSCSCMGRSPQSKAGPAVSLR